MEHKRIAAEVARYFYLHLQEEQTKTPELIDRIVFDGRSPRDITDEVIRKTLDEFPELTSAEPAPYNFIRRWTEMNRFHLDYSDFAYEAYNLIFFQRLHALKNWSPEAIEEFHRVTHQIFEKFDWRQDGFSISFFIRVENNMRELLREIAQSIAGIDQDRAWEIVFEQSKEYQEIVNEFFESILQEERDRSERLLLNILPKSISEELKERDRVEPRSLESVTVLFTDFKGFTMLSEKMSPAELVAELDECFSIFDEILDRHGLEKIKTIGDAYMCAGGIPQPNHTHAYDAALAALEMRDAIHKLKIEHEVLEKPYWDVRIGLHTGPLVAGVIGKRKFSYDVWGDTVNTASRMESSGAPGQVNISGATYAAIRYFFECEPRGLVQAKNKGELDMYFLKGLRPKYAADDSRTRPNAAFQDLYGRVQAGARVRFQSEVAPKK